jgi:tetratricopeptide (TPR) repeat protein
MMRVLVVTLCVTLSLGASAAPPEDPVAEARGHYRAGEGYFAAGDFGRAADEYAAAYQLAPKPLLLFNLGAAYRRKAQVSHAEADWRAARQSYQAYLDADPRGPGSADARRFLAAIEKELVVIGPPPARPAESAAAPPSDAAPPAAAPVAPAPAPAAPVPTTPMPVLAAALAAEPVSPVAAPTSTSDGVVGDHHGWRIAGLVTGAAGVALLATGAVFALQAKGATDELQALPPGAMWDQGKQERADAARDRALVCAGAGVAAVAGGAVMTWVLGRPTPVQASVDGGAVSVALVGRFR